MSWERVKVSDDRLRGLRDRHYSCRRPGGRTVGPPGRRVAFVLEHGDALAGWLTHWPNPAMVFHGLGDAWVCTLFRNETELLSSQLIREAVSATRHELGEPPQAGFLTFVDAGKVRPKRDPGRCFRRAGFVERGRTRDRGLIVLQLEREACR